MKKFKKLLKAPAILLAVFALSGMVVSCSEDEEQSGTNISYTKPVLPASNGENPFAGKKISYKEDWGYGDYRLQSYDFSAATVTLQDEVKEGDEPSLGTCVYDYSYDTSKKELYLALKSLNDPWLGTKSFTNPTELYNSLPSMSNNEGVKESFLWCASLGGDEPPAGKEFCDEQSLKNFEVFLLENYKKSCKDFFEKTETYKYEVKDGVISLKRSGLPFRAMGRGPYDEYLFDESEATICSGKYIVTGYPSYDVENNKIKVTGKGIFERADKDNDGEYDYATFKNVPSVEFELTYAISGEKASITFVKVPQEFNDLLNTTINNLWVESVNEEDYTIE